MLDAKYSRKEVAVRGEVIYEQAIRPIVESESKGKYLVLDIETGEFEIDQDDVVATKRVLARCPHAVLYGLRIGYPAAYRLGGFSATTMMSERLRAVGSDREILIQLAAAAGRSLACKHGANPLWLTRLGTSGPRRKRYWETSDRRKAVVLACEACATHARSERRSLAASISRRSYAD